MNGYAHIPTGLTLPYLYERSNRAGNSITEATLEKVSRQDAGENGG